MAQLSFVESMKDRASRLLPNPFTEVVGEATSDLLLTPDWDKMLLVCDHANVPQSTTDVIQAIRNRVDDSSPKVQVLTLVLVETLVKNCGRNVHQELGEKKGLLRDIVNLCVKDAVRDVERDARSAALQLVMNLSHWFARDRDPKVQNLAQIANNARTAGANFTDVEPDTTVALREHVAPPEYLARAHAPAANTAQADAARRRQQNRAQMTRRQQQHQQQQQHAAHGAHGARGPLHHVVVDAIPIEMPEEAAMANMMETVMLLAELLTAEEDQAATSTQPSAVQSNEVLLGVMQQVQSDHVKMFRLVTCEAPLEGRDALAIVTDSQEAVLQRFELLLNRGVDTTGAGGAHSADPSAHGQGQQQPQVQQQGQHQGLPPPQDQAAHAQREAQYLQQQTQQYPPAPVPAPLHGGASDVTPVPLPTTGHQQQQQQQQQQQPPAPQPTAPEPHAPTIDELFGQLPSNTDQSTAGPSPPILAQAATTPIAGGATTVSGAALEGPSGHAAQDPFAHIRPEPEATAAPHQQPHQYQHHVDATQQGAIADAAMAAFDVTPLNVSAGAGSPSRNRAAADIDEAPTASAPAPPAQQQYRSAFPAPAQAMDPRSGPSASEMAKRDTTVDDNTDNKAADASAEKSAATAPAQGEAPVAPAHGSINADGIDAVPVVTADDDFDAFLNERLAA